MIAYTDILILPYEGQHEPKELIGTDATQASMVQETADVGTTAVKVDLKPERKTIALPMGKLQSTNIGIKNTLNPPKKNGADEDEALPESHEQYSEDDLKKYWNEYAYKLKSASRDSLFTTLTHSDMTVSSDHSIKLKIKNHQVNELESEKIQLLRYLRFNLKNTKINLAYSIEETESITVMDSKTTFEKLAAENESLNKLRKMFNLDVEF